VAEPLSVTVFDYGTGTKTTTELMQIVKENFDLRPGRIVKDLKLKNPIFQQSATYGHFGREIFTWEQPKTLKF
jgi:S-adenosylmethionine synthetase